MELTRKEFLKMSTVAAAGLATVSSSGLLAACSPATAATDKIKRGVSIYCYSGVLNMDMTLEDCFADMYDMGAHGLEILASHVEGYPNPTDEWVEWFKSMMIKYELTPVEYGHWVDSKLYFGKEYLNTKESAERLIADLRLAKKLGFTRTRTMLGITDVMRTPVPNWEEFVEMALPVAEECNIKMGVEIHIPSKVDDAYLYDEYINFIEKTGTKNFGFTLDFGVFSSTPPNQAPRPGGDPFRFSLPKDVVPILPYVYCCHAKFKNMSEECLDLDIPYPEIIDVMKKNNWEGYLLSEYEGKNKDDAAFMSEQLHRQHVMLRRILGA